MLEFGKYVRVKDVESLLAFERGLGAVLESIVKHGFYICSGTSEGC